MNNLEFNEELFNKNKRKIIENFNLIRNINNFYKETLQGIKEIEAYSDFCKIPILTKKIFSENKEMFFKDVIKKENAEHYSTSGTSGVPLKIIRDKVDDVQQNLILNFYRTRNCKKIIGKKGVQFAFFYKESFTGNFEILKYDEHFCRFCYYVVNDELIGDVLSYIDVEKPSWITGSSSFIFKLAQYKLKNNNFNFQLDYIECNSEHLSDFARETIVKAFDVNPTCIYGSNEHNAIAYQCKNGNFHVMEQNVFVEILDDKSVIITSLLNKKTGLLRYEQGDLAEWVYKKCDCGCMGPIIKLTGFRKNDYITNGKISMDMWFFNGIIKDFQIKHNAVIDQYKVIQDGDNVSVSIIVENPKKFQYKSECEENIKHQFANIFGDSLNVSVEFIDILDIDQNVGKFRYFTKK